jgi:hypothetical protein
MVNVTLHRRQRSIFGQSSPIWMPDDLNAAATMWLHRPPLAPDASIF